MSRLTIALPDPRHRALKEAAARSGKTIGALIDEALAFYGIKSADEVTEFVAAARRHADMAEDEALAIATAEVRNARRSAK